jgi:Mn2+/Fe2+ NRAMP family transporter
MRRAQFVVGIVMVLAFLASGAYMHFHLGHLRGFPLALRMVYRASHINMLLIGAVNVFASRRIDRGIERIASALAIVAAVFFVVAFIVEPGFADLFRPWTRLGVYATFAAILLEVAAVSYFRRVDSEEEP